MKIKCAAIRYEGKVYEGSSHGEIGHQMIVDKVCTRPYPAGDAQGFVTDTGAFVDRATALRIAIDAGQIKPNPSMVAELFSEDLKRGCTGK